MQETSRNFMRDGRALQADLERLKADLMMLHAQAQFTAAAAAPLLSPQGSQVPPSPPGFAAPEGGPPQPPLGTTPGGTAAASVPMGGAPQSQPPSPHDGFSRDSSAQPATAPAWQFYDPQLLHSQPCFAAPPPPVVQEGGCPPRGDPRVPWQQPQPQPWQQQQQQPPPPPAQPQPPPDAWMHAAQQPRTYAPAAGGMPGPPPAARAWSHTSSATARSGTLSSGPSWTSTSRRRSSPGLCARGGGSSTAIQTLSASCCTSRRPRFPS